MDVREILGKAFNGSCGEHVYRAETAMTSEDAQREVQFGIDELLACLKNANLTIEADWNTDMGVAPRGGLAENESFLAYWPKHQTADGDSYAAHMEVTWMNKKGLFTTNVAIMDGYFPEDWQPTAWKPLNPPGEG